MELKIFESPGKEWDEFASRYTDLVFYQSLWSEVLRKGLGGQPLYFCLSDGMEIVAGLPSVLLDFRIFKILYASVPYGNLIGERSFFGAFTEILDREFRERKIDQVRISESPFSGYHPPGSFRPVAAKCTLLDLRKFDRTGISNGYREEVRRAIRKGEREGLTVKGITTPGETQVFYQLYLSSMARNRAAAKYPLRWFGALYDVLIQRKQADILFAMKGDRHAAGVVLIHSPTSVHYLHNGSEPSLLQHRPNDLLVDHIIRRGVEEGKIFLDFMGSDRNDESLLRFKEKWGSRTSEIHTYVKNYHRVRSKMWELARNAANSRIGSRIMRWIR
jgi:hypothetical protein